MTSDRPKTSHSLPTTITIAALLALVSLPSAAEIYRCTVNGQQVMQDQPCHPPAGNQPTPARPTTLSSKPRPPIGDPSYEEARTRERLENVKQWSKQAGAALEKDLSKISAKCGQAGNSAPHIGAKADWVQSCSAWGAPQDVLKTTTADGTTEMWIYSHHGTLFFGPTGLLRTIIAK